MLEINITLVYHLSHKMLDGGKTEGTNDYQ